MITCLTRIWHQIVFLLIEIYFCSSRILYPEDYRSKLWLIVVKCDEITSKRPKFRILRRGRGREHFNVLISIFYFIYTLALSNSKIMRILDWTELHYSSLFHHFSCVFSQYFFWILLYFCSVFFYQISKAFII